MKWIQSDRNSDLKKLTWLWFLSSIGWPLQLPATVDHPHVLRMAYTRMHFQLDITLQEEPVVVHLCTIPATPTILCLVTTE